jgi:hypothetical protein
MIFSLSSVQLALRVQVLSLFALIFADLVFSVPTTEILRRDSIEQQLSVKPASRCSTLDEDDVRSLPGWPKVEKYISDTWGNGNFTFKVNPSNYRDKPGTLCIVDPVHIKPSGVHKCMSKRVGIRPKKGTRVVDVEFGYRNIGHWNITRVASAAHAELFLGHFKVAELGFMDARAINGLGEFVNAPHNSFTTVASNMTYRKTELTSLKDQVCSATIQQRECRVASAGRIQLVATGYLWITFETARTPIGNPNGGKHRRYAVKIEEVLNDAPDRSVWIDYEGVISATTRTDYFNECRPKRVWI